MCNFFSRSVFLFLLAVTVQCSLYRSDSEIPGFAAYPSDHFFEYDPLSPTLQKYNQSTSIKDSVIGPAHIDGISPVATLKIPVSCDLRHDLLPAESSLHQRLVIFYNLTYHRVEVSRIYHNIKTCTLIVAPEKPMIPGSIYSVLISRKLNENPSWSNINSEYREFIDQVYYGRIDTESAESIQFLLKALRQKYGVSFKDFQSIQLFPVRSVHNMTGFFLNLRNTIQQHSQIERKIKHTGTCSGSFEQTVYWSCPGIAQCDSIKAQYGNSSSIKGTLELSQRAIQITDKKLAPDEKGFIQIIDPIEGKDPDLNVLKSIQISLLLNDLPEIKSRLRCSNRSEAFVYGICNPRGFCGGMLSMTGKIDALFMQSTEEKFVEQIPARSKAINLSEPNAHHYLLQTDPLNLRALLLAPRRIPGFPRIYFIKNRPLNSIIEEVLGK